MMRILFITPYLPYENAPQAGANVTFNLMKLIKENYECDVDLVCFTKNNEENKFISSIKKYVENITTFNIDNKIRIKNIIRNIHLPIICSVKYDKRVEKSIKMYFERNKYDYIILDFTHSCNYVNYIKNLDKSVKVALIEQDVSFLSYKRKFYNETNLIKKVFRFIEFKRLYYFENKIIKKFDKVFTLNEKDLKLLSYRDNVRCLTPYYKKYEFIPKIHNTFNIMFWGAMSRKENEDAIEYFMNSIWPYVNKENVKFYIIGSNPTEKIKSYKSNSVIVTGFVQNPNEYFEMMDISVVPLRYGAGIKIKVLESMAAGIPVVMTSVGAEGINIKNKEGCFISDNPLEFAGFINNIIDNNKLLQNMKVLSKLSINEKYNFENNLEVFKEFF